MRKSLHNQEMVIHEFAESRSRDRNLKERLDRMTHQQEGFGQLIVEVLSSTASSTLRSNAYSTFQPSLERDLMDAVQNSPKAAGYEDLKNLQISPNRLARVRRQFIDIFRYESMFDRETSVAQAHSDTLKWLFKDPSDETHKWDNFRRWLESQDQLYWITGKMGSGKSTLMKYVSEKPPAPMAASRERRCTPHLLRWARDRPLFIATFYFWAGSNEETGIQTSVEGLYRTLLTQIFETYPEAAPRVSPRRWENLCLFNKDSKPPGIAELKAILSKAIDYVSSVAKVCLFIDGLDEFEGEEDDLQGLITWVKTLVETSPVKLCVASRPWQVFEDALQDRPHLLMEDFNFNDIQKYVGRRFHDDPNFRSKRQMEPAVCDQLLDEIVTKSDGVFLWVHLVCSRLLQEMARGDLAGDLRRILDDLPVQMEKLYGHILDNLDLKDHAAKYFMLLQAFLGRPDALIFSFADDIGEDREFSLKMRNESLGPAEIRAELGTEMQYRANELRKRLNSRCRGILCLSLEPHGSRPSYEIGIVQYCHRSAKDYFTMAVNREKLIHMLDAPFDPHLRLCSAYLARWKFVPRKFFTRQSLASIYACVSHAELSDSKSSDMMIRILDELNPDFDNHSYFYHFDSHDWFGGNLLSLTVRLGVAEYVKHKIQRGQGCVVRSLSVRTPPVPVDIKRIRRRRGEEFGRSAGRVGGLLNKQWVKFRPGRQFTLSAQAGEVAWPLLLDALLSATPPNPEMVSLLLGNGANPNTIISQAGLKRRSVLELFVSRVASDPVQPSEHSDEKKAWMDSFCHLLQHGAKPDRSDVQFLRDFIGEDVIHARKLPHLRRHREFISKHLASLRTGQGGW